MAVTIFNQQGASYTWATATWTWDDVQAGKTWDTAYASDYTVVDDDGFATAELGARDVVEASPEALVTAETPAKIVTEAQSEAFATVDTATDVMAYVRNEPETLATAELLEKLPLQGFSEAFTTADTGDVEAVFNQFFSESMAFAETYIDLIAFILSVSESFGLVEQNPKDITVPDAEAFATSEFGERLITEAQSEAVAFAETYIDLISWLNDIGETVSFSELAAKIVTAIETDSVGFIERVLRNADGVFGDVEVRDTFMTAAQFAALVGLRAPVGYSGWKEFVPGDYDYQTALTRLVVSVTDRLQEATISSAKQRVDVPDLVERGTATITNASTGVTVTFQQAYKAAPEVTIIQKSGATVAVPQFVSAPTNTGFTVKLLDVNNPSVAVTGSISYTAIGY